MKHHNHGAAFLNIHSLIPVFGGICRVFERNGQTIQFYAFLSPAVN